MFNEVNTIPGFTPHSRYPTMMQCRRHPLPGAGEPPDPAGGASYEGGAVQPAADALRAAGAGEPSASPPAEEPPAAADSSGRAVSQYPAGAAGRPAAGRLHPGSRRGAGDRARSPAGAARRSSRPSGRTPWQRRGEAFTRQYVAVPGCSEHQTGLAIDLGRAARADRLHPARLSGRKAPAGGFRRLARPVWLHPAVPPGKGVPDRYRL